MKSLLIIPRTLWKTLFLSNFLLGLIVLYPLFRIFLMKESWFPYCFKVMRFWGKWILFVPCVILKKKWEVNSDDMPKTVVYCANHVSYLDIISSYPLIDKYFVFMAKAELGKTPLFGIFFKNMNILVNRESTIASHKAFVEAGEHIKKGHSVFLFPEGRISKKAPEMLPFKNGAFKLAIETKTPIVPITFINNGKLLQNGGYFKSIGKPGISRVVVHAPIPTDHLTLDDLVSLKEKVKNVIQETLNNNGNY